MKYNTKAILTVPAWANALHEGEGSQRDEITSTAMAYAYVPLIFRATRLICNSLVSVPVKIYKGEDEADWPFPDVSLRGLLWRSEAAMLLTGANFIEKMPRKMSKKVGGLQWVNPTTMNPPKLVRADGAVEFEFTQKKNPDQKWDLSTMIYMREFSLSDDVGPGNSSAGVALGNARLLHYMSRFAARFFETGAMPITVLQIEGLVDEDEAKRIEGFFKRAATRLKNAWNVLALSRAIEPKVVSQPLKDLVMPDLADEARRAVADAFDMHPSLLDEAPNMATAQEHRLSLYQDSIEPRALLLAEEFNRQLLKPIGFEMVFAFDEMDIYQEDEAGRSQSLNEIVTALSTDPELGAWAMGVLGYDLTDEQKADLKKLLTEKQKQKEDEAARQRDLAQAQSSSADGSPPPQAGGAQPQPAQRSQGKTAWADDLGRWQRKALRVFTESGAASCLFESDLIPAEMRSQIEADLIDAQSPDDIKAAFNQTAGAEISQPVYETGDIKSLAAALNTLASAHMMTALTAQAVRQQAAPAPATKEDDMRVNIINPQKVEVTSDETLKALAALTAQWEALSVKDTPAPIVNVLVPETLAPVVNVTVPETVIPAPVVNVNIPEAPAPVINNEISVQPADVIIQPETRRDVTLNVKRDREGRITGATGSVQEK